MEKIQFIGLNKLDLTEQQIINEEFEKFLEKFGKTHNVENAILHLKQYSKSGNKAKNSMHCRINFSGKIFSAKAIEWKASKALKRCIQKLEKEVSHHFKSKGLY